MSDLHVREAGPADADSVRAVIHAAFAARPPLDPPSNALEETTESVREILGDVGGLICFADGAAAGAMLFADLGAALGFRRVSVVPGQQSRGVASALVEAGERAAAARQYDDVSLLARAELPATMTFWFNRGYCEVARDGTSVTMGRALPVQVRAATPEATYDLGSRIATLVRRGDVVILTGDLGAGKTMLTRGIGAGLQVRGDVTSPTFVISRIHPSRVGGPPLVHVDAYRLGDGAELDDMDLDASVEDSVTVVEWGEGLAEALSPNRLHVHLERRPGTAAPDLDADEVRAIGVTPVGARWVGSRVRSTLAGQAPRGA